VQVKNFHLTLQIELLMEILKILVLIFSSVIPLIKKNVLIPRPLNFNLTLQMESYMKILKILIFNISSVILLVKLN
jgi:CRISPR/Cas system CSM-associated protein Csm4 (group 5 of RAMP superfamily)